MRRFRGAIIVACSTAVMSAAAEAQQRVQLMRVRIYAPTIQRQPLVGSLMIARTDSVTVDPGNGRELSRMPVVHPSGVIFVGLGCMFGGVTNGQVST